MTAVNKLMRSTEKRERILAALRAANGAHVTKRALKEAACCKTDGALADHLYALQLAKLIKIGPPPLRIVTLVEVRK